ncbi:LysR family transcriptional regulator [Roseomonas sp. E05]|uniref:LysR family transcriptional regulator n=1 Tax=Roseomonas sp. E05 TaxID=3046310 RepID=UPI0024BBBA64|nr:LysR family transcriptional regulator [Roseomonas sp. E05]MDJ0388746.1 LysR family transcriptional regulator [Roseomonas sp. E05]
MSDSTRAMAWDDVRLIDAIAREGSLPAAAARLGIHHSTAFRRLGQIEAMLGCPLFERRRAGYVPTQAGEEMAALAKRVDEDITAVTRRLAGQVPSPAGEVRLATSDSLLADLLLPMLVRFRAAHPAIRLDVITGNTALNLSRRDADVALRASDAPPETLVGRRVARIAWALYGTAGLAVETAAWVLPGEGLRSLKTLRRHQARIAPERIAGRFDSVLALSGAIRAGLGIGHLPCFVGDTQPGLVRLSPPVAELAGTLWLLTHPDLRQTPRIRVLLDHLAEEITLCRPLVEGTSPAA